MADIQGDQVKAEGTVAEVATSAEPTKIENNAEEVKVNAPEENPTVQDEAPVEQQNGDEKVETEEKQENGTTEETNGHVNGNEDKTVDDKMDTSPDAKPEESKVEVGEKRAREDDDDEDMNASEEEKSEKENGKEVKKAKIDIEENGVDGDAPKAEDKPVEEPTTTEKPTETETTPSKKKPGRPKKSETEAKIAEQQPDSTETIAARTRSKA